MVATYFQISGCYCQISGYYCKIGGYLPKSLETPLYRGVSQREVCAGYLPHTSLIPPSYLPRNRPNVKTHQLESKICAFFEEKLATAE